MSLPFEDILKTLTGEVIARRNTVFVIFVSISLSLLALGSVWPKHYTAFSIVQADSSNILQPLMQGSAEATRVTDYAGNAREIIHGEVIMNQILEEGGWLKANPSEVEQAQLKKSIGNRLVIKGIGKNLIKIQYTDNKAMRAFITAKRISELFIQEGERYKMNESMAAYNFIEKQVNEYLEKLITVEEKLKEFRSRNPDARPGLDAEVSGRINRLTRDIESTHLLLSETLIRRESLREQLSGEAAITISQSKEGQYRSKIADLQTRLETLRLDYQETYPDIVRVKHQIDDLKQSMNNEIAQREEAKNRARTSGISYIDEAIFLNPLYQQLRSNASSTETEIQTLRARVSEMNKMLEGEYARARRIHGGETELSKLTRNYQVNQEIYQDLLRRLERARVSRNLDKENQGLTFKIQEPAKIPLIPTGFRFLHFMLAGLALGTMVPIGLIYVMLQIDPRIRFSKTITEDLNVPVLAEISQISSLSDRRRTKINLFLLATGFIMVMVIYGYVGWLKYIGQL
ncbi:hypothetical protein MNBD_GAMMA11-1323 [hydrothermal vent metagenome]|uniref:Polysaccharide chain length determinant N-terminal domain-containing protein n=1 Tax=hydrothermal vent metagenome TaxID=652676 RepID=A0A3B0XNG6_9ZZZZ